MYIDFFDLEPCAFLDIALDALLKGANHLGNAIAVIDAYIDVDNCCFVVVKKDMDIAVF